MRPAGPAAPGVAWQVAEALNLSVNTVRNHTQHLLTKLDAHSRLEAVAIATRLGILRAR